MKVLLAPASQGEEELPASLSGAALAGLYKEAAIAARLGHPNVIQLLGVCTFPPAIVTGALLFRRGRAV